MRDIAPDIFRQRLLIEGYYTIDVIRPTVERYLRCLAEHLDLRTYDQPVIFSPGTGMGREENQGFDAFVPLVDSGISAYIWSSARFFSVVVCSCKAFDKEAAIKYTEDYFGASEEVVHLAF